MPTTENPDIVLHFPDEEQQQVVLIENYCPLWTQYTESQGKEAGTVLSELNHDIKANNTSAVIRTVVSPDFRSNFRFLDFQLFR